MNSPSYTDNLDTLVALITQMAMSKHALRTPAGLAKDLTIDEAKIRTALDTYKGLFRRSSKLSSDGSAQYGLHLRYARQWIGSDAIDGDGNKPLPLEANDLANLLSFVADRANQEANRKETIWSNRTAVIIAVIAFAGGIAGSVLSAVLTRCATN